MECANKIEITFKSGDTITIEKEKWDDYSYDGKFFIIKNKGAWVAFYNCNDVFCFELK